LNWLAIFNEVFSVSWLVAVLWLLYRHAIGGAAHVNRLNLLLNENTVKSVTSAEESAQAARTASDAALKAVEINARLVALLQEEHKDA
jgi:hypothetical protein